MLFGSSTPPEPMGQLTGFLLNWVGARSREAFAAAIEELGLRPQQFAAMTMIDADPGMAQQELVAATNIDPSTMVAMLDGLEAAGLAERRPHASDRRKHALHLTEAGTETLRAARRAAAGMRDEVFGRLEPEEFAELHRLLRKTAGYVD
ncbi:putative HTH-type transcriptional regulator [Paraconexibacter sp. AEG42_29]|uniref:HTH-type transcriptional regulator n=1 Tax=Paraconexibacter sp. AEG42_29 TaxID=2997339 RepID=A0AAU7ARS3_9ACTN